MDKMSKEIISRRDFLRAAATAVAGSLVACLPRSTAIPTPESQSTPVPTTVLPTEVPFTPEPPVDLTAEAIKRTTLDSNLTDISGDVLLQGIGGEISGVFGDPKITSPLSATQIEAARAMLGQKNAGTLYAVPGGKAVIQRLTGVKDGIDYSTLTDDKVPFRVTVTMLPNTFLQADGERIILPDKTKPGEARYIKINDQTQWNVTSTFLVEPGFLPTGAAFWWDMSGMNLRPVMWDGKGNPRLMENIPVEVKLATIEPTPTPTPTEAPKMTLENWKEVFTGPHIGGDGKTYNLGIIFGEDVNTVLTDPDQIKMLPLGIPIMILNPDGKIVIYADPEVAAVRAKEGAIVLATKNLTPATDAMYALSAVTLQYQKGHKNFYVQFNENSPFIEQTPNGSHSVNDGFTFNLERVFQITLDDGTIVTPIMGMPKHFKVGHAGEAGILTLEQAGIKLDPDDPKWLDKILKAGYSMISVYARDPRE